MGLRFCINIRLRKLSHFVVGLCACGSFADVNNSYSMISYWLSKCVNIPKIQSITNLINMHLRPYISIF